MTPTSSPPIGQLTPEMATLLVPYNDDDEDVGNFDDAFFSRNNEDIYNVTNSPPIIGQLTLEMATL